MIFLSVESGDLVTEALMVSTPILLHAITNANDKATIDHRYLDLILSIRITILVDPLHQNTNKIVITSILVWRLLDGVWPIYEVIR